MGKTSLFAVDPTSRGVKRLFPSEPGREGDSQPAFSPDGGWLAYPSVIAAWTQQLLVRRMGSGLQPKLKIIAMSGAFEPSILKAALYFRPPREFTKPLSPEALLQCIEQPS
jgi:hypothetical protein